jgi:aldehyde dehydrogenase (NAD+)
MREKENLKYCSIINRRHFERIKGLVEDAVSKGAVISSGGGFDESFNLITPTLLTRVAADSEIMEEEIFGPVLPIIPYEDIKEVYHYIKSKPKPLALYIFGRDKGAIKDILKNTQSGDVCINNVILHVSNVNLPFGGFNNSGIGKTHGYHGFMAFTHERSVLKQGAINTASLLYPPFKPNSSKLVKMIMKLL